MGWDAHSSVAVDWKRKEPRIKHPDIRKAFESAAKEVQEIAETCDWLLPLGSLDVSTCRYMLTEATGESCYDDWSKEKVQKLNERAYWDFKVDEESLWAYWSARKFLELCAQFKLSVTFSY